MSIVRHSRVDASLPDSGRLGREHVLSEPVRRDGWGKRVLDVVVAAGGLVVLSPLFGVCAVLAKCQSPGPAFFLGPRVGRGGRIFRMVKFRTMVMDAPCLGSSVTAGDDPRVTRIGRLLRATKLDELPNLLNVLQGTMSLVGPRPELPRYVALYDERQRRVLAVRPGITGPTQLAYRDEEELLRGQKDVEEYYITHVMPRKLEMDLAYIGARTLGRDVVHLLRTLIPTLRGPAAPEDAR
jgi:lipopolysaccharide/colanic/teichoic acid biosynthesis glycosyltransferase